MARRKRERIITHDVGLVMLAALCFMSSNMLATPISAGYAQYLGASGQMMGVVAGAMSLVSLFARPFAGMLADKVSKRAMVLAGALFYIAAGLLYAFAVSPAMLVAARVVNGLGFACCSVCLAAWVSLLLPVRHMGAGMGIYGLVNALAMAIGPALGLRLQRYIGYRRTFLNSIVLAVIMVVAILLVKDSGRAPGRKTDPATAGGRRQSLIRRTVKRVIEPRVLPLSMTFMMFAIPYFANQSFISTYISERGVNATAELFFAFYAVALIIIRVVLRDWFDAKGFRFWMVVCSLCMIGQLGALALLNNDAMLALAALFTAGGYGVMSTVTQAQAVIIAGRERAGVANGTYYLGIDLGMSLGPIIGGLLYAHAPIDAFYPLFMLCVPIAWVIYLSFSSVIHSKAGEKAA